MLVEGADSSSAGYSKFITVCGPVVALIMMRRSTSEEDQSNWLPFHKVICDRRHTLLIICSVSVRTDSLYFGLYSSL